MALIVEPLRALPPPQPPRPPPLPVKLVILDLDGTLLATEHAVSRAASDVLAAYDAELTPEASAAALGRRPLEAWAAVAESLSGILPEEVTPERLLRESEERLVEGWKDVAPLPGAKRLVEYLRKVAEERREGKGSNSSSDELVLALVTSTPSKTFALKTGPGSQGEVFGHSSWDVVVCGDDVAEGKPDPEGLLLAVERASELLLSRRKKRGEEESSSAAAAPLILPPECLVIEDSPAGAKAAVAAGMRCVVVPSLREKAGSKSPFPPVVVAEGEEEGEREGAVVAKIPTLFAFDPAPFALPPFSDSIAGGRALRLDPLLRLEGTVVSGFGRGSAELGIPTANLDGEALARGLDGSVSGIFAAFSRVFFEKDKVLSEKIFPAVLSVGYNPQFDNGEKERRGEKRRVFGWRERPREEGNEGEGKGPENQALSLPHSSFPSFSKQPTIITRPPHLRALDPRRSRAAPERLQGSEDEASRRCLPESGGQVRERGEARGDDPERRRRGQERAGGDRGAESGPLAGDGRVTKKGGNSLLIF